MSLQQNIKNSFGQSNYFENKDQLRQEVNEFVRGKRTEKAIGRNLRRGFRAKIGSKENNAAMQLYDAATKMGIEDPDGGGGFGMEAGRARKFAEFTLNRNFEEEQKRKRELEERTGGAPAAGQQNAGVQTVIGPDGVPRDVVPQANAVNAKQDQGKPVLTKPDWAKDVEKDKTFPKGFFDDPANLERIQGKSRAEVAEMLNKEKAARFMAGATARGDALKDALKNEDISKEAEALGIKMRNQQIEFNTQVDSKVNNALIQANRIIPYNDSVHGHEEGGLSTIDKTAILDAQQIAQAFNNDVRRTSDIMSKVGNTLEPLGLGLGISDNLNEQNPKAQKFVEALNKNLFNADEGFQSPGVDYYSMSTEEKLADFQKRSKKVDAKYKPKNEVPYMYELTDGEISVVKNPEFKKSREVKEYENLKFQAGDYNSKLQTNARNQVIFEAQKKQQKINEQLQQRDQYRQQRIEQEKMLNEAYSLFR